MSKLKTGVEAKIVDETYSRTFLPAITYFFISLLIFFWRFNSVKFIPQFEFGGALMALCCLLRIFIWYRSKSLVFEKQKFLPYLNGVVILTGLTWTFVIGLIIAEFPIISLQLFLCFGITNAVLAAIPFSLIGVPRVQLFFSFCIGLFPAAMFGYRCFYEHVGFEYYSFPALILLNCLYVVALSKKLREGFILMLEQQERIQQDLVAAKDIQRSLLPETIQKFNHASLQILYKPCEELSGDFFEIHSHQDLVLFYIADVTSHGTAAAQVTYLLKAAFRNTISSLGDKIDIAEITRRICAEYVSYKLNYAISLFTASYNLKTGDIQYVTSNFPNPLMVSDKGVEILSSADNPVIDAAHFVSDQLFIKCEANLSLGAHLYAFTDGAYEFRNIKSRREFGYKKFSKLLVDSQSENWTRTLEESLERANGSPTFEDDITVLCLTRT